MLLKQRPSEEKRAAKIQETFESPTKSLREMLGVLNCKIAGLASGIQTLTDCRQIPCSVSADPTRSARASVSWSLWTVVLYLYSTARFYASLGILRKMHDTLVIFGYERQTAVDPENTSYYLECLQGIAEGRNSDELETKAAMEITSDKVSKRDVRMAYKELGIPVSDNIDDDTILGTFQARLSDAGQHQEEGLRRALKILGTHRASAKIQNAASMCKQTKSSNHQLIWIFLP